ncbi:Flp family type IVb pilin [Duganella qianjiadongensis]|uniref:Flp family type IVb pilin n=1 Tax=Duganella qianjiadongensis TaxID=2692176 RepID=A0ABW9VM48_9BURK|nr:Flp family type IVb pilin [Duganella qianjiadongensis]MYM40679.1 Flp family type IVb pilin [Duganella qianjiadongensis]
MHALIQAAHKAVTAFAHDDDGITAIEYGLIAAVMVGAVVAAFGVLTPALNAAFTDMASRIHT